MTDLFSRLWKLPSGSIVKVTRELHEPLSAMPLIGAVYVASADPGAKMLEIRRDWFDTFARVV
jgi:hypothetical protein